MSSLLKKFTSDNTDARIPRRDEDLANFQRPRDFMTQQMPINRPADTNRTNLCSDVQIKGTITFKDYLRLDGKFEGELNSPGTLLVGENGVVRAEIQVGSLIVEGKIFGNVTAQDKIELRSTAQLFGDIKASRLIIGEGVVFVGKSDVNPAQKIEQLTPSSTPESRTPSDEPSDPSEQDTTLRNNQY